ncbi:MAG: TIGR00725 family protein, partial [Nocardioides sp.]
AEAGGTTLGILPGGGRAEANPWVTVSVPTGIGELRNGLLVRSVDALVSVGGSWGTLSEVALACRTGVPVWAIRGWDLPEPGGPVVVTDAAAAVAAALAHLRR